MFNFILRRKPEGEPEEEKQIEDYEAEIAKYRVPQAESYMIQDGEWKNRKISILGAARSFISQLRVGQDLTRVALPAAFLRPYSLLEAIGCRHISRFHLLQQANKIEDPKERMLCVIKYLLSRHLDESKEFYKKPYNPLLGEVHHCRVEKKESTTYFVAEQVSHHPPVSAFMLNNEEDDITMESYCWFQVKFYTNSLTIPTLGRAKIHLGKFDENYFLPKSLPDVWVLKIIWGEKLVMWVGDVSLVCHETGLSAHLHFEAKGDQNLVTGYLHDCTKEEPIPIYTFEGEVGHEIKIVEDTDCPENNGKVFINMKDIPADSVVFDSEEEREAMDSINVWSGVNKAIVDDDMATAEQRKVALEQLQRKRARENRNPEVKYFLELEAETSEEVEVKVEEIHLRNSTERETQNAPASEPDRSVESPSQEKKKPGEKKGKKRILSKAKSPIKAPIKGAAKLGKAVSSSKNSTKNVERAKSTPVSLRPMSPVTPLKWAANKEAVRERRSNKQENGGTEKEKETKQNDPSEEQSESKQQDAC